MTCDCSFNNWHRKHNVAIFQLFNDIEYGASNHLEYFFTKGCLLSYIGEKQSLYLALDAIEKFSLAEENEYTFYIKSNIYGRLKEPQKSMDSLSMALNISKSPRLLYRIGRVMEFDLNQNGLNYLYDAFMKNHSSGCCVGLLRSAFKKQKLNFELTDSIVDNELLRNFTGITYNGPFRFLYEKIFSEQINNSLSIETINEFLSVLNLHSNLFLERKEENILILEDLEEENRGYYDDYNSYSDQYSDSDYSDYNDQLDMDQQSQDFWDSL